MINRPPFPRINHLSQRGIPISKRTAAFEQNRAEPPSRSPRGRLHVMLEELISRREREQTINRANTTIAANVQLLYFEWVRFFEAADSFMVFFLYPPWRQRRHVFFFFFFLLFFLFFFWVRRNTEKVPETAPIRWNDENGRIVTLWPHCYVNTVRYGRIVTLTPDLVWRAPRRCWRAPGGRRRAPG